MNFNITTNQDYNFQAGITDELINLYGINCKFLVVQKVNKDINVFGDFSHIKIDNKKVFSIYLMPETSEEGINTNIQFTQFGYYSTGAVNLFISKKSMERIFPKLYDSKGLGDVLGNLIILPSGGILEVTDCQYEVPGISNASFLSIDNKNVYRLTCITYLQKQQNEIDPVNTAQSNFVTLENYFEELITGNEAQDTEATNEDSSGSIPVPNVDSVFGRF